MSSDDRSRRPNEPATGGDPSSSSDFGSFVSSSVRDSFRKLKADQPPAAAEAPPEPAVTSSRRSRRHSDPAASPESSPPATSNQLGTPVGRKWRDNLPGGTSRNRDIPESAVEYESSADDPEPSGDAEGGGFDFGAWFKTTFYDENGPNRKFWALIAAAIVIILLVIYLLSLGGDGNKGDETPTPTSTTVVTTDHTATPSRIIRPNINKTPTVVVKEPNRTTEPTPTPPVEVGGDNTRG